MDGQGIPAENKSRNIYFKTFADKIKNRGHDGIIVNVPYGQDIGSTGERVKQLREVFGITQVVKFPEEQHP
jgi:23S rRNA G2445 N2-methylase RlmL